MKKNAMFIIIIGFILIGTFLILMLPQLTESGKVSQEHKTVSKKTIGGNEKVQQQKENNIQKIKEKNENSNEVNKPIVTNNQESQNANPINRTEEKNSTHYFTLWVDQNHFINRDEGYAENLGWFILYNGQQVLDRNAQGETQYQYFSQQPGIYTVYLNAWVDGKYETVSNVVSYEIK